MKVVYKKFDHLTPRTYQNFEEWYENLGGEILPPEELWLQMKFKK